MTAKVEILPDDDALAQRACAVTLAILAAAIRERGRASIALSGGSTPEKLHRLLAASGQLAGVHFYFGDERFVPHDDPASNFGMAQRTLFGPANIGAGQIHSVNTQMPSPQASASDYAHRLAASFGVHSEGPPPAFDLILLGLGSDGHTASLFPGAAALTADPLWVTWSPPGELPPPVDRITLTLPTINAARNVLFLVAGADKADAVKRALGEPDIPRTPASGVRNATWLLDVAAAGQSA